MNERIDQELDWDDIIENDGSDWVLLPEGVYPFTVTGFDRKRFEGSAKLPPCLQAELHLEIDGGEKGRASINHNLFLHTKTEGLLGAFFAAIGLKKKDEPLRMDWTKVVGASGFCQVGIRTWTDKDGNARESNQVKKFLPPENAEKRNGFGEPEVSEVLRFPQGNQVGSPWRGEEETAEAKLPASRQGLDSGRGDMATRTPELRESYGEPVPKAAGAAPRMEREADSRGDMATRTPGWKAGSF